VSEPVDLALDHGSADRLRRRWPDGCGDLAAAVPADAFVVRTEDSWFVGDSSEGAWLRAVDLARAATGPSRDDLLSAARQRAAALGFKPVGYEEDAAREVFRRVDKSVLKAAPRFLRLAPGTLQLPTTALPIVQIDLEVGCPWHDMHPRVERSSAAALAATLGLKKAPAWIRLETLFDPGDLTEVLAVREAIRFKQRRALRGPLTEQGFAADDAGRKFEKSERQSRGELTVTVAAAEGHVTAEIILDRSKRRR